MSNTFKFKTCTFIDDLIKSNPNSLEVCFKNTVAEWLKSEISKNSGVNKSAIITNLNYFLLK